MANIFEPDIIFPTMRYVRPAKAQTSLRIRALYRTDSKQPKPPISHRLKATFSCHANAASICRAWRGCKIEISVISKCLRKKYICLKYPEFRISSRRQDILNSKLIPSHSTCLKNGLRHCTSTSRLLYESRGYVLSVLLNAISQCLWWVLN